MRAGVSAEKDWDMNSLCVPRVAKEAIGAICTLRRHDGTCMTVNVEYNQLDPLLRSTVQAKGATFSSSALHVHVHRCQRLSRPLLLTDGPDRPKKCVHMLHSLVLLRCCCPHPGG